MTIPWAAGGGWNSYTAAAEANAPLPYPQRKELPKMPVNQQLLGALANAKPELFNALYQRAVFKNNGATPDEDDLEEIVAGMTGRMLPELDELNRIAQGEAVDMSALHPAYRATLERTGATPASIAQAAAKLYPEVPPAEAARRWMAKAQKVDYGDLKYGAKTDNPLDQWASMMPPTTESGG